MDFGFGFIVLIVGFSLGLFSMYYANAIKDLDEETPQNDSNNHQILIHNWQEN
jgi:hypothetical protein